MIARVLLLLVSVFVVSCCGSKVTPPSDGIEETDTVAPEPESPVTEPLVPNNVDDSISLVVGHDTMSTSSSSASVTSKVSVSSATGTIGGHGYVDLGLSVKWATCNVGASSPEDYGSYFAWEREDFSGISDYPTFDAARANWGSPWRMPTKAECQELIDNCTWTWTTNNGKQGCKVVSKKNSNSIFLPAAGYDNYDPPLCDGTHGGYWSSTGGDNVHTACGLYFGSDYHDLFSSNRNFGQSVRLVSE